MMIIVQVSVMSVVSASSWQSVCNVCTQREQHLPHLPLLPLLSPPRQSAQDKVNWILFERKFPADRKLIRPSSLYQILFEKQSDRSYQPVISQGEMFPSYINADSILNFVFHIWGQVRFIRLASMEDRVLLLATLLCAEVQFNKYIK